MAETTSEGVRIDPSLFVVVKEQRLSILREIVANLSAYEQLRVRLSGSVYVGDYRMPGWSGALPFYAFSCQKHGLVVNYPTGYRKQLLCPHCLEEG